MSLIPIGFWAASGGGGVGAFDLLETTTLTSSASSVTFSGLDAYSDYKHLQIRAITRCTPNSSFNFYSYINGNTSASYARHTLFGTGSSVLSQATTSTNQPSLGLVASPDSNTYVSFVIDYLDFSSSSKNTTMRGVYGFTHSNGNQIGLASAAYFNTSAVTSIALTASTDAHQAGSRFSLYGVK